MESVKKYLKITGRFRKLDMGLQKFHNGEKRLRHFLLACENFARGCEIHSQFCKACEISSWAIHKLANISQGVAKFMNVRFLL